MIRVEPDAGGSPVESQVRCDKHGIIASRFAVLTSAGESALRHAYYRHREDAYEPEVLISGIRGRWFPRNAR